MENNSTEARESLRVAARVGIDQSEGRTVYAWACAGFGLIFGVFFALVQGKWFEGSFWVTLAYVVLVCALAGWQTHATRAVPRGARTVGRWGLALTMVAIIGALGVVNSVYRNGSAPVWAWVAAGVVVAAPLLVTAAVVRRGPR